MKIIGNRKGVTLVEVLVAISLFAVIVTITVNIMINVAQIEKKSSVESAIYEDLRFVMQRLTDEIQNGAIDYEEYYSYYVLQNGKSEDAYYGINYGVYGSRFFDPGKSKDLNPTNNPVDLGLECSLTNNDGECGVIYALSTDINTGQHPFTGDPNEASAFCEKSIGICNGEPIDHLFLIDKTGTRKTIIAGKKINTSNSGDWAVGMVEMEALDIDQNGVIDAFRCMDNYFCDAVAKNVAEAIKLPYDAILPGPETKEAIVAANKLSLPNNADLKQVFTAKDLSDNQFVPISPLRSNIKNLRFIISPLEDPYKAYYEAGALMQPSVTIILTIGLSDAAAEDYPGDFEDITVQTTVTAGVLNRIDSYPPVNDVGVGWINIPDVLPNGFAVP